MSPIIFIPIALILFGAMAMGLAIQRAIRILSLLQGEAIVRYWRWLIRLMAVFLLGYCLAIGLVITQAWIFLAFLTGLVFCLGSGFVWFTVSITRNTLEQLLHTRISQQQYQIAQAETEQALLQLKHTQTQLIQSEKMIGLRHLVAGLAHEINNPLTFVLGNLAYLKDYGQDLLDILAAYEQHYPQLHPAMASVIEEKELDFLKADLPKLYNSMDEGLKRIEQIVIAFNTFSHLGKSSQKEIDILKSLDSCMLILQSRLAAQGDREGITIVKDYLAIPLINCHGSLINQVLMHLLDNAIDATRQTSATATQMKEPTIWLGVRYFAEQDQIMISIRDNGSGICPDIRSQIFDPFFTTKDVGQGLGLGLAVSYQIITVQHQGSLVVNDIPTGGTEFVVTLPR